MVVIDHVSLPPARLEKIQRRGSGRAERQPRRLKRQSMMALSCANNRHFRGPQRRIVGGSESPVVRQFLNLRILEIRRDDRPQVVHFPFTCLVGVNFSFGL